MADAHFTRSQRLLNAADYKAVFDASELRASTATILVLARRNGLTHARLGLVVSKRSCRLATGRNRLKRLIRESFRNEKDRVSGLDIVVLSRRGLGELDNRSITDQLSSLWSRLQKQAGRNSEPTAG